MDLRMEPAGWMARILALVSLFIGLGDAARLVGFDAEPGISPMVRLGSTGFALVVIFCLMRLFAAVGLWIQTRWGAVLLAASTGVEVALFLGGSLWLQTGLIDFSFKLVVFVATILLLVFARMLAARGAPD